MIEPFRPIADLHVVRLLDSREPGSDLTVTDKRELARLLGADVELLIGPERQIVSILTAIERQADGLLAALTARTPAALPQPMPLTPAE